MNSTLQSAPRRSNSAIDLSQFDTSVPNGNHDVLRPSDTMPDGRYDVRIEDAELTTARSGNPMIKYSLRVIGPSYANKPLWKYRAITTNTVQYVKDELKVCGLDLGARFSELGERLHEIIDAELEITRKTRGEDVNIYFNRLIDGNSAPSEDDLPF